MSVFDVEKQASARPPPKPKSRRAGTFFLFTAGCLACLILVKVYLMWHAHDQLFLHHHELSKYISDRGSRVTEPHSGQFPEQGAFYQDLVRQRKNVRTVCEIGFNAGHSDVENSHAALTWLDSSPETIVFSFDLMEHQYSSIALKFLKERYPDRISVIKGDAKNTVNEFIAMHHTMCDLIHIDTGTKDITDYIKNFRSAAHCDTILIVTGVRCDATVGEEWNKLKSKGEIEQISDHITSQDNCDKNDDLCAVRCASWTIGRYPFQC